MSQTPKTDAATQCCNTHPDYVHAAFARELEIENRDLRAQLQDLTARLAEIEANCDHEWENVDDSFSHEHGIEVIRFCRCAKCGKTKEQEDVDDEPPEREDDEPDYDAPKPLTPLENWERNDERNVP